MAGSSASPAVDALTWLMVPVTVWSKKEETREGYCATPAITASTRTAHAAAFVTAAMRPDAEYQSRSMTTPSSAAPPQGLQIASLMRVLTAVTTSSSGAMYSPGCAILLCSPLVAATPQLASDSVALPIIVSVAAPMSRTSPPQPRS